MYNRRLKILLLLMGLAAIAVIGRLAQLQLIAGDEYRRKVEEMISLPETLSTIRGQILDRRGQLLAMDRPCYDFCLDYRMLTEDEGWTSRQIGRIVRELAGHKPSSDEAKRLRPRAQEAYRQQVEHTWALAEELTGASRNEMARAGQSAVRKVQAMHEAAARPVQEERMAHAVVTGLDETTAVELRTRLEEMIGAAVTPSHRRFYPYGEAADHVIGVLGQVNAQEQERLNAHSPNLPLEVRLGNYFDGDLIGRSGVEKACEDILRGRRGCRVRRRSGELVQETPPAFGTNVQLTLDIELQRALAAELNRPGAIVVLDVPTGGVLAMVSLPGYDLNEYSHKYDQLSADQVELPLWNRCVAMRYPPGSSFKPLMAVAALANKVITEDTSIYCRGYLDDPNQFRCWIHRYNVGGHKGENVVGALRDSCNVFFYTIGERLGLARQCDWLTHMGFADLPGTGLPEERASLLPEVRSGPAAVGEARHLGIGQGTVETTPMHVAAAIAAIARNGTFLSPVLVRQLAQRQVRRQLNIPARSLELVQLGMYEVVNAAQGTGKHAKDDETEICGKTGTATTWPRRADTNGDGRIDNRDDIVKSGDTAWFVGYAPYRNPKIAFAVVVEYVSPEEGGGGQICGPVARNLVKVCKKMGYL